MPRIVAEAANRPALMIGIATIAIGIPAFFVLPSIDDWNTSRPIFDFDTRLLLPGRLWRPFEKLLRWTVGLNTGMHPWLFHGIAVLGHAAGVILLYRILRSVSESAGPPLAGALFFALSPATVAAVWSVDSAVQTCSTAFGLASLLLLLKYPHRRGVPAAMGCAVVATLWKESGLAWFFAAPLFAAAVTELDSSKSRVSFRKTLFTIGAGVCVIGLYFVCRAGLATVDGLGTETGRYAIQWELAVWLKNAALLAGVSSLQVDTVSLFGGGSRLVAFFTVIGGLPLGIWACVRVVRSLKNRRTWIAIAATAAVIAPHIVLKHVSEMYAHPVVPALVLTVVVAGENSPRSLRSAFPWFGLAMLVGIGVSAHKWSAMAHSGKRAETVAEAIVRHYGAPDVIPERVCTVAVRLNPKSGYSVFTADPAGASNWGRSVWAMTEWRLPKDIVNIGSIQDCPSSIRDVWQIDSTGTFTVAFTRHQQ